MNRREFIMASAAAAGFAGSASAGAKSAGGRILFGVCRPLGDAPLLKSVGFDFLESTVGASLMPTKGGDDWKRQRDVIANLAVPLRSCNSFIPGKFRLTGPAADMDPALDYAEIALRRAEEVGVKTIVFGSGGARNVPGDYLAKKRTDRPDVEAGVRQYTEFCRRLCKRVSDLQSVTVVIEPLRPNESNIVNYVWQGVQICNDVGSPRLRMLADFFHMMMGRESADSVRQAGSLLAHCHIAERVSRAFPGNDPALNRHYKAYFDALRAIGYTGGVSCECSWGKEKKNLAKNLETALATLRAL